MFDIRNNRLRLIVVAACAISAPIPYVIAAEPAKVDAVIGEQTKSVSAAKTSQSTVTKLDDEAGTMLGEYRQAIEEYQSLKAYNDQLATQVSSQQEELAAINAQLGDIDTTSREVLPMLIRMMTTLEQFVAVDVPFLPDERAKRIKTLKTTMERADVSLSEKYRRIVEAYQIEMEYGRTIESYAGKIGDKTVEFLRAGRVSLLYQTLDGNETGYWDNSSKKWVVDNAYREDIKSAIKIAKKQAAPNFVALAAPAPKEAK
ncbi:Protein of unknown function [Hydrocarboniphaga daqingensis]|uniref:DUF3450 domain-containing protein n=1 Tax=Hydrocarboniphaga daqingensis TaxID=490188 RepID=A0A1M5NZ85_9GAMM|nr:DUF3450 domain-containing protein [Hydrocarboniphaga daqingensis]SHG94499.1 Protein of unknown function [Hydrocarboniphaga daqingensis]